MSILHIDDAVRDMEDLPADEDERLERSVLQKTSDGDSAGAVLAFEHLYAHLCKSLMPDFDRVKTVPSPWWWILENVGEMSLGTLARYYPNF